MCLRSSRQCVLWIVKKASYAHNMRQIAVHLGPPLIIT
jgi:hypothetical protein